MILNFIKTLPWPLIAVVLSGKVIPYLSARFSSSTEYAGYVTQVLAFVGSIAATYAQMGSHFNWKIALAAYFATWGTARLQHSTSLSGTQFERRLHSRSVRGVVTKGRGQRIDGGAVDTETTLTVLVIAGVLALTIYLIVSKLA